MQEIAFQLANPGNEETWRRLDQLAGSEERIANKKAVLPSTKISSKVRAETDKKE